MKGNFGFASQLLDTLKKHNNKAGIMLSSSVQATVMTCNEVFDPGHPDTFFEPV